MPYTKQTWVDGSSGQTPLNASRLNYMEDGIAAAATSQVMVSVKDYGAKGDGTTDDAAAIQAAINAASTAGGGTVFIPATTTRYRTLTGIIHRSNVDVVSNGARIRNEGAADFTTAIAWHFGTYGPGNGPQAVQLEPGWALAPSAAGTSQLALATASNASNFVAGDIVSWEGGTNGVVAPRLPNGVAKVAKVANGVLYLDRPIPVALTTADATPVVRKLNASKLIGVGGAAFLLTNALLRGLTIETTKDGYPPINIGCMDCVIEDVHTIGAMSLSGNPVVGSRFERITGTYTHGAVEFAYMSHDNEVINCRWSRAGTDSTPGGAIGVWVNSGEGGRDTHFRDCEVIDVTPDASTSNFPAVQLASGCTWTGGRIIAGRTGGMFVYGDNCRVEDAYVSTTAGDAIQVGGNGSVITGNRIARVGTGTDAFGIRASQFAVDTTIVNNTIGEAGSRTSAHVIRDLGTRTIKRGNRTFVADESKVALFQVFSVGTTGVQAEYDIVARSFAAGTVFDSGQGFRFRASGYAGGAGTKTIRVKIDAEVAISFNASGLWSVDGLIFTASGGTSWLFDSRINNGGALSAQAGGINLSWSSATKFAVTGQSTDASDQLDSHIREVSFSSDFSGFA